MAQPLLWGKDLERELIDYMEQNQGEFYRRGGMAKSDTVPAMLTPGEFVVNKDAVSRYGAGFFEAINNLTAPAQALAGRALAGVQGFATGGLVQPSGSRLARPVLATDAVPSRTVRVDEASAHIGAKRLPILPAVVGGLDLIVPGERVEEVLADEGVQATHPFALQVGVHPRRRRQGFNPRPAHVSRASWTTPPNSPASNVFQSSPGSREPGVSIRGLGVNQHHGFNPRPAHVSRASRLRRLDRAGTTMFQSSPGSREPGVARAARAAAPSLCFNPRPAHVSRASSTPELAGFYACQVSILARLT